MKSKEKNVCLCGGKYIGKNKLQHMKTKKHRLFEIAEDIIARDPLNVQGAKLKDIQKKIIK